MADDTKRHMTDDEYQFPSDEFITSEPDHAEQTEQAQPHHEEHSQHSVIDHVNEDEHDVEDVYESTTVDHSATHQDDAANMYGQPPASPSIFDRLRALPHKRIIGVIIFAVVVLIAFKIMRPSHKTQIKQPQKNTAVQNALARQQMAESQAAGALKQVKNAEQNNQSSINTLQNQVQNLQNELNQSHAQQAQTTQALQVLVGQVKDLTKDIKALQKKPKHKKSGPVAPKLTFQLKAVVPGRAWILGSNGETDSVTIGAKVPQYGYVTSINADRGVVRTSSGKRIVYGPNDF